MRVTRLGIRVYDTAMIDAPEHDGDLTTKIVINAVPLPLSRGDNSGE